MKTMDLDSIKISKMFAKSIPSQWKMDKRRKDFIENGIGNKLIKVDENNYLVDGYITYLILKEFGVEKTKVRECNKEKKIFRSLEKLRNDSRYYVYGVHGNCEKEYVWVIPKSLEGEFIGKVLPGDKIIVHTKNGGKRVTVTRIVLLNNPPVEQRIRRVVKVA